MDKKNINSYIFAFLLVFFFFLQLTFVPQTFSGTIAPNLVLILLIAGSMIFKSYDMLYVSFFAGYLLDIFSGGRFGIMTFGVLLSVFVSSYLGYFFLKELFSLKFFLISSLAVIVYNVTYFLLINYNSGKITEDPNQLLLITSFEILYCFFLIYPLAFVLSYKK